MLAAYFAKYSLEKREELSEKYKVIWEDDEQILECRSCANPFSFFNRKHHCRYCGGIYCGMCASLIDRGGRKCYNCIRGLSPSKDLMEVHKNITKIPFSINQRKEYIASVQPDVAFGSLYNDNFERLDLTKAHECGYFQVTNRSEEMCCIKVVADGACNIYHEVFRPPYYTIPPLESIYAIIPGSVNAVLVIALYDNEVPVEEGESFVFKAVSAERISDCAKVSNFQKFAIYKVRCRGRNVLLKYKEQGALEPRDGQGRRLVHKAAGFLSGVLRTSSSASLTSENDDSEVATLDLSTNVESIEEVMRM